MDDGSIGSVFAGLRLSAGGEDSVYRAIGELVPYGIWIADAKGRVRYLSRSFLDMVGLTLEQCATYEWARRLAPERLEETRRAWRACVAEGGFWNWEHAVLDRDGAWRTVLTRGVPIRGHDGRILAWAGINLDITDRKQAERALRESEERFRLMAETVPDILFIARPDGRCDYASSRFEDYTGMSALGHGWAEAIHPDDRERAQRDYREAIRTGGPYETRYRLRGRDGRYRWFMARTRFERDEAGNILRAFGSSTDIDALVRAEAEKDLLLKEVNHRVKNGLQLVSSILNLQARKIADPAMRAQFEAAASRVATLGQVHRGLYGAGPVDRLDFGDYLRQFCADLRKAVGGGAAPIAVAVEADDEDLSLDQAIPLALIANELITNACKYAFDEAGGTVAVGFRAREDEIRLTVTDDGRGLPDGFDPARGGLGMTMIVTLAQQLGGRLDIARRAPGVAFTVAFAR